MASSVGDLVLAKVLPESLPRLAGKDGLAVKADTVAKESSVKIYSFIIAWAMVSVADCDQFHFMRALFLENDVGTANGG